MLSCGSDLSVPPQAGWNWHLFPSLGKTRIGEVVKASQGHYPQPFLISNYKELVQRNIAGFDFPNTFIMVSLGVLADYQILRD